MVPGAAAAVTDGLPLSRSADGIGNFFPGYRQAYDLQRFSTLARRHEYAVRTPPSVLLVTRWEHRPSTWRRAVGAQQDAAIFEWVLSTTVDPRGYLA